MNTREEKRHEPPADGIDIDLSGLSADHQQQIREIAQRQGTTVQAVLREIIRRGLLSKKNPDHR